MPVEDALFAGGDGREMNEIDFGLIETMRLDDRIVLLDRHIARLKRSAEIFGIPFDEDLFRARVASACTGVDSRMPHRIRAVVDTDGTSDISIAPLSATDGPLRVAISATRVDRKDPFLYHKTTRRERYDREWRAAQEAGIFELLYLNQDAMVTEGSRANIFVRSAEELLTPPVECGLLPGVYRSLVLETFPSAREVQLDESHLRQADAVLVCNAVIGLKTVRLIDSTDEFSA